MNAFLIKMTEFFRDPQLFDYLKENELPGLIEEAREKENELRIWSAGCATGEEV
jgi:two-component system CheB/CheR fusion protein